MKRGYIVIDHLGHPRELVREVISEDIGDPRELAREDFGMVLMRGKRGTCFPSAAAATVSIKTTSDFAAAKRLPWASHVISWKVWEIKIK